MKKYVYPAIFTPEESGKYSVFFPDIEGCSTFGNDLSDAIEMAEDSLSLMLYDMEEDNEEIPTPTRLEDVVVEKPSFVNYISVDTLAYRKKFNSKAVKKTLSIPEWLNDASMTAGLNFSQILQDGLKKALNIF